MEAQLAYFVSGSSTQPALVKIPSAIGDIADCAQEILESGP